MGLNAKEPTAEATRLDQFLMKKSPRLKREVREDVKQLLNKYYDDDAQDLVGCLVDGEMLGVSFDSETLMHTGKANSFQGIWLSVQLNDAGVVVSALFADKKVMIFDPGGYEAGKKDGTALTLITQLAASNVGELINILSSEDPNMHGSRINFHFHITIKLFELLARIDRHFGKEFRRKPKAWKDGNAVNVNMSPIKLLMVKHFSENSPSSMDDVRDNGHISIQLTEVGPLCQLHVIQIWTWASTKIEGTSGKSSALGCSEVMENEKYGRIALFAASSHAGIPSESNAREMNTNWEILISDLEDKFDFKGGVLIWSLRIQPEQQRPPKLSSEKRIRVSETNAGVERGRSLVK